MHLVRDRDLRLLADEKVTIHFNLLYAFYKYFDCLRLLILVNHIVTSTKNAQL